jgi:hypothetical protein
MYTSTSRALAIFTSVSGCGHLLLLSMFLKKGMEISAFSANSIWDKDR